MLILCFTEELIPRKDISPTFTFPPVHAPGPAPEKLAK